MEFYLLLLPFTVVRDVENLLFSSPSLAGYKVEFHFSPACFLLGGHLAIAAPAAWPSPTERDRVEQELGRLAVAERRQEYMCCDWRAWWSSRHNTVSPDLRVDRAFIVATACPNCCVISVFFTRYTLCTRRTEA